MSSSSPFRIIEHVVPCQNIRQYPAATANKQEDVLHLAVKQYIPIDNPQPNPGDVTIVAAPGIGFGKELYEPIWEELYGRSKEQGYCIRSIWAADMAQEGESGLINKDLLGNDPSSFDHSRDLLQLINVKREEMPRPIVGIGHSIGATALVHLSLMHPRLIHTLVLLDPAILRPVTALLNNTLFDQSDMIGPRLQLLTYRRDTWPSRDAAACSFRQNPFYKTWDPRALDRFVTYGLRDIPTHTSVTNTSGKPHEPVPVTLTTPLAKELASFARPYYNLPVPGAGPDHLRNRLTHPDLDPQLKTVMPFYRPEIAQMFYQLPYLRPSVLYIFASESPICQAEMRADRLQNTGTGVGGSGGVAAGRVREAVLQGCSHQVPFEAVDACADEIARWFGREIRRWGEEEQAFNDSWARKSLAEKTTVDEEWKRHVPKPRRVKSNL